MFLIVFFFFTFWLIRKYVWGNLKKFKNKAKIIARTCKYFIILLIISKHPWRKISCLKLEHRFTEEKKG